MASVGIYTFGNNCVYDQLVALLNSIEANVSSDIPICIIPYDRNLDQVELEIRSRKNVSLFDDWESIHRWDEFVNQVWAAHPIARHKSSRSAWFYGGNTHRKLVSFEGPFDKFVFYDTDSLAMKPLDDLYAKLDQYDFIFDDWEHIKDRPVAALDINLIESTGIYQEAEIRPKLHCSSFFGSKRGLFDQLRLESLKKRLIDEGEVAWINPKAWWDEAALFTYMTLRSPGTFFNYTLSPNGSERTGNCANADPFFAVDGILYNQEGLKPIHRIHYMGYSSVDFSRLFRGEAVNIPHRDIFLHYRFLKQADRKPQTLKPAGIPVKIQRKVQDTIKKLKKVIAS